MDCGSLVAALLRKIKDTLAGWPEIVGKFKNI
jgi:hypothetical protein